jgi:hypothetical protein
MYTSTVLPLVAALLSPAAAYVPQPRASIGRNASEPCGVISKGLSDGTFDESVSAEVHTPNSLEN